MGEVVEFGRRRPLFVACSECGKRAPLCSVFGSCPSCKVPFEVVEGRRPAPRSDRFDHLAALVFDDPDEASHSGRSPS